MANESTSSRTDECSQIKQTEVQNSVLKYVDACVSEESSETPIVSSIDWLLRKCLRNRYTWLVLVVSYIFAAVINGFSLLAILFSICTFSLYCSIIIARARLNAARRYYNLSRKRESRIRRVVRSSPVNHWISGFDLGRMFLNDSSLISEAVGEKSWLERIHPEDRERVENEIHNAIDNRKPFSMEYRVLKADEEYQFVLDRGVLIQGTDDKADSYIGSTIDISDTSNNVAIQKKKVELLTQIQESLEEQIKSANTKYKQLEYACDSAVGAYRARTELLSTLSEEIGSTVETMISMTNLMQITDMTSEQQHFLATIQAAADAMVNLVDNVIEPEKRAKLELPDPANKTENYDLPAMIESVSESLRNLAEAKGIKVFCQLGDDLPVHVRGNQSSLRQIIMYVTNNVFKLVNYGTIGIKTYLNRTVGEEYVIDIVLEHSGKAIPDEKLNQLIHCSSQVDGRPVEGGKPYAGLGLSIARKMLEPMNGRLDITNRDQTGFSFIISFQVEKVPLPGNDKRNYSRFNQEMLECNLGKVLDLSLGGMRVLATGLKPPENAVDIEIEYEDKNVRLCGEVVWTTRTGFRKHEVGIKFIGVTPNTAREVTRISMLHRQQQTFNAA